MPLSAQLTPPIQLGTLVVELAFEEVRRAYFNDKPSRFHCVFASPDLASAQKFRSEFRTGATIFEMRFLMTARSTREILGS